MRMGMVRFNETYCNSIQNCEECPALNSCNSSSAISARLDVESRRISILLAAVAIQKNELDVLRKKITEESHLK